MSYPGPATLVLSDGTEFAVTAELRTRMHGKFKTWGGGIMTLDDQSDL